MAITHAYGLVEPQNGDTGSTFFPQIAADIAQIDGHTHNGSNSALLTSTSITPVSATISSGSWIATSGGTYRQSVQTPAGITYDSYGVQFRDNATGNVVALTVEKIDATHFYAYTNDNTKNYKVLYLV